MSCLNNEEELGSSVESTIGEFSSDSFDCEVDAVPGEGEGHAGNGPGGDAGGEEEIRRVDEEIETKVWQKTGTGMKQKNGLADEPEPSGRRNRTV